MTWWARPRRSELRRPESGRRGRRSQKARRAGATPPRNVLLAGPPGAGKHHSAGRGAQLDAPLLVASAAEIVKGKYAGVGVERVRTLFAAARRVAARSTGRLAVVFIDELDSVEESEAATRRR